MSTKQMGTVKAMIDGWNVALDAMAGGDYTANVTIDLRLVGDLDQIKEFTSGIRAGDLVRTFGVSREDAPMLVGRPKRTYDFSEE